MASQIMETIAATERACDEKKQAAKEKATAIADEAQKKCEDMRAQAAAFARAKEKEILADAEKKAAALVEAGREKNRAAGERLKAESEPRRQAAVKQTALYLLELAKRGS